MTVPKNESRRRLNHANQLRKDYVCPDNDWDQLEADYSNLFSAYNKWHGTSSGSSVRQLTYLRLVTEMTYNDPREDFDSLCSIFSLCFALNEKEDLIFDRRLRSEIYKTKNFICWVAFKMSLSST